MSETLSKHALFKAIGLKFNYIGLHGMALDLKIMLGGLERNRDTWRRRAIREARRRIRIAKQKNQIASVYRRLIKLVAEDLESLDNKNTELLTAIHRLPEPSPAYGDGPDERVGWILGELALWKTSHERAVQENEELKAEMWCLRGERERVTFLDASLDIKQRLVVAEATLEAIRERAERVEEGEPWDLLKFVLKMTTPVHAPECLKNTAFPQCVCTCGAERN